MPNEDLDSHGAFRKLLLAAGQLAGMLSSASCGWTSSAVTPRALDLQRQKDLLSGWLHACGTRSRSRWVARPRAGARGTSIRHRDDLTRAARSARARAPELLLDIMRMEEGVPR
jgi:hypothetical protein